MVQYFTSNNYNEIIKPCSSSHNTKYCFTSNFLATSCGYNIVINKNINLSKYFNLLEWGQNPQPVGFTVTLCVTAPRLASIDGLNNNKIIIKNS